MERAERERDTKRKRKERERDDDDEIPTSKTKDGGGETNPNPHKAKSCKGCLYYSSALKSHSSNPLCIGITRSLPQGQFYFLYVKDSALIQQRLWVSFVIKDYSFDLNGFSILLDS